MPLHATSDGQPLAVEVDTPEDVIALFTSFHSAAVATVCVELAVAETTFSCAVTAEHDPSFDITLEVVVPHGYAQPSERIQRAVKAAAREWESVLTQGFPDHSNVVLQLVESTKVVIPHMDDLYIGYYFDPEQRGRTVATTYTWPTRLKPTKPGRPMLRSYSSGIRFYPRADTLRFEWLVKLAVHEIGHAILFNGAPNDYGGLWDRSRDMWIAADGVRAYHASGGEGAGVPMVNGIHWPWHFLQETTSGGDIMESKVNSHAVLGGRRHCTWRVLQ